MDYQILKDEVTNNPKQISGLDWNKTDEWIANILNTAGISGETIARESIATKDILNCLVYSEVFALEVKQIQILNLFCYANDVNPGNSNIQGMFLGLFPSGDTKDNLVALALRPASRTEKLYETGKTASPTDIHIARRLP